MTSAEQTRAELIRDVNEGVEQLNRGEYVEYDVTELHKLVEEIKRTGRERLDKQQG